MARRDPFAEIITRTYALINDLDMGCLCHIGIPVVDCAHCQPLRRRIVSLVTRYAVECWVAGADACSQTHRWRVNRDGVREPRIG